MNRARPQVTISIAVPAPVFTGLIELARKAGQPREFYTTNLLLAAYAARRGSTGDEALEKAVRSPEPPNVDVQPQRPDDAAVLRRISSLESALATATAAKEKAEREAAHRLQAIHDAYAAGEQTEKALRDNRSEHLQALKRIESLTQELQGERARHEETQQRLTAVKADRDQLAALARSAAKSQAEAADAPDPEQALQIADCTRRMIIALRASGLNAGQIARETDTPIEAVRAVLDQHTKRRA